MASQEPVGQLNTHSAVTFQVGLATPRPWRARQASLLRRGVGGTRALNFKPLAGHGAWGPAHRNRSLERRWNEPWNTRLKGRLAAVVGTGYNRRLAGAAQAGSWQLTIDAAIPSPTPSIPPLHGATPNQQPTSPTDLISQHRCVLRMPRSRQCHDPCAVPACRLASSRPWSDPKSTDDDGAPLRWETNRRRFDAKNDAIRPFNTNTAPPSQFSGGQLPAT